MFSIEKAGQGIDWFIRGHFVFQLLIAAGGATLMQWLVEKYLHLPTQLAVAIWLFTAAALLWALMVVFKKRAFFQQTGLQTVDASPIETNIKSVADFYKDCSGPFLDELEAHFQRLAAHHKDAKEREQFLIRALAGGSVSYLHDMTWASIFRSQLQVLNELNSAGAKMLNELRPFYDAAAAADPGVYKSYPFEAWVSFMKGQGLIRQDGNVVQITVRGKDLLKYMVTYGRSEKQRKF